VLAELIDDKKQHVALTATHDAELVDFLRDSYLVCHLGDAVGPDGLNFGYRLTPGPATSRNAIALLGAQRRAGIDRDPHTRTCGRARSAAATSRGRCVKAIPRIPGQPFSAID
jgi:DNA mismatch repair ATPase MutS